MSKENKVSAMIGHNKEVNKFVKDCLGKALLILMQSKPFDQISITAICLKAGVSRMAFYNNFKTKEELLENMVSSRNHALYHIIGSPFRPYRGAKWYETLFEEVARQKHFLIPIFNAGFKHKYLSLVNALVLHDSSIAPWDRYMRLIWAGGVVNTIIYWLESGQKESVEEIAEFCHKNLSFQPQI